MQTNYNVDASHRTESLALEGQVEAPVTQTSVKFIRCFSCFILGRQRSLSVASCLLLLLVLADDCCLWLSWCLQ